MIPVALWTISLDDYLRGRGLIYRPFWLFCSLSEYASLSPGARRALDRQQDAAAKAILDGQRDWRQAVMLAYRQGEITLDTPELSQDAAALIREEQAQIAYDTFADQFQTAVRWNRSLALTELAPGDYAYLPTYNTIGQVVKCFKRSVRLLLPDGDVVTEPIRRIWRHPMEGLVAYWVSCGSPRQQPEAWVQMHLDWQNQLKPFDLVLARWRWMGRNLAVSAMVCKVKTSHILVALREAVGDYALNQQVALPVMPTLQIGVFPLAHRGQRGFPAAELYTTPDNLLPDDVRVLRESQNG